ncbi:MAG: hypothetical protein AB7I19_20560 [Planctomycetota bacterium]
MTDSEPLAHPRLGRRGPPNRGPRPRKGSFEIGNVLGKTFRIWLSNLLPISVFALLIFAPFGAFLFWTAASSEPPVDTAAWQWIGLLLVPLLVALLAAPIVGMVFAQLRGRRTSFPEALATGFARMVPALGAAFLIALVEFAILLAGRALDDYASIATAVPLLLVHCGLLVAVPAAVVEHSGPLAELRRSWQLTQGHKARIFLILVLFVLVLHLALTAATGLGAVVLDRDIDQDLPGFWAVTYGVTAVLGSLAAVFAGVVYHDLLAAVDGVDADGIAAASN